MKHLRDAVALAIESLNGIGAEFALVGGLAVSAWCDPRTTRDVDLAVAVETDEDAEQLIFALQSREFTVLQTVEQVGTGRLATARLHPPDSPVGGAIVDLLFASSGIEVEVVAGAVSLTILKGVDAPVAQVGHLIALKLLSRDDDKRPQDLVDLRALLTRASPSDIAQASDAIELITSRGFNRGRDLETALHEVAP